MTLTSPADLDKVVVFEGTRSRRKRGRSNKELDRKKGNYSIFEWKANGAGAGGGGGDVQRKKSAKDTCPRL